MQWKVSELKLDIELLKQPIGAHGTNITPGSDVIGEYFECDWGSHGFVSPEDSLASGQWFPAAVFCATGNTLFNKMNSFDAIVDVGENGVAFGHALPISVGDHLVKAAAVNIGKSFEKCLGMTSRQAAGSPC